MLKLVNYRCRDCGSVENDLFDDEPVPECCGTPMAYVAFPKGSVPRATFKLFREYTVDKVRVTSKEQETQIKQAACKPGESVNDVKLIKESAYDRKVKIEELRNEAIEKFEARSPQIAERIKNRPMPEFVD